MEVEIVEWTEESPQVHRSVFSDPTRDVSIGGRGRGKVRTGAPISVSLGAMVPLVGKLNMLLLDPPQGCSKRAKDGIRLLKHDVEEISSYLDELSEVEDPRPMVMCWMNEAHDLSYEMEDYIDSLLFLRPVDPFVVPENMKATSFGKLSSQVKIPERPQWDKKIADMLSEFRIYVQEAIERYQRYDLHSCSTLRHRFVSLGPMLPAQYDEETDYIVVDVRTNEFINSLVANYGADQQQIKTVSILGPSCLGKTTLAKVLYNRMGGQFDCRAFIRVSKKPEMKRIFCDMLSQLKPQNLPQDFKDIDLIIDNIKKFLQDKRYLIIIDDLWATSAWDIINHAFTKGSQGSIIIVTTQFEDVALTCCCDQSEHVFQMKPLDDEHSRKLFFSRLFGSESDCPEEFTQVCNKIVEICDGLPLATISIASLIASQSIMSIDLMKYIHQSLSSFSANSTSERMRQVLNISYNNLPPYLKTCLLHLSMYPEGYTFYKDDLVKQWVAEGLIGTTERQDIEKVAESYLHQLIGRRFIYPIWNKYNNEVLSCTVHDMVHDLITQKSAENNFTVAIDSSQKNVALSHKVRRLSLLFGDARYANTPTNIRKSSVRSLTFFGLYYCMPSIREFKLLRVLNLQLSGCRSGDNYNAQLTAISELLQLRYLKIASDVFIHLPYSMGGLQFLETLDTTRVTRLPGDIICLPHLLHLTVPLDESMFDWIYAISDSCNSVISLWRRGKLKDLQDLHLTFCPYSMLFHLNPKRNMDVLGFLLGGHGNLKSIVAHGSSAKNIEGSNTPKVFISWDHVEPPPPSPEI